MATQDQLQGVVVPSHNSVTNYMTWFGATNEVSILNVAGGLYALVLVIRTTPDSQGPALRPGKAQAANRAAKPTDPGGRLRTPPDVAAGSGWLTPLLEPTRNA